MPKQKLDILFRSKILVGLIAATLLALGVLQVIQGLIDTRDYRDQIVAAIKERTGRDVIIKGNVRITVLPTPTIFVPGVEIRNLQSTVPTPSLTIEMLRINAALFSLFSPRPEITSIVFEKPTLELERAQDNVIYWDWLNSDFLKSLTTSEGIAVGIAIQEGKILYHNNRNDRELAIQNINATGASGTNPGLGGTFSAYGHILNFAMDTKSDSAAVGGGIPLQIRIFSDEKNMLRLEGGLNFAAEPPRVNGTVSLEIEDALGWTSQQRQQQREPTLFEQITNTPVPKTDEKAVLPLKFSGAWSQEGWDIKLTNVQLQGFNSTGSGTIGLSWEKDFATDIAMEFSTFDYNQWRTLAARIATQQSLAAFFYVGNSDTPLPQDARCTLNLKAAEVSLGGQVWRNALLSAHLENAAITVNQLSVDLPGESTLALFGVVSQGSTRALRFEGSMETQGKSLRDTLTIFDESAADLPKTTFREFYVRSNVFVSAEQIRLSEAVVKVSDLQLGGGLVGYFDENPRLEADVRLKDINFDYFRDVWRQEQKEAGQQDFFLKFDKNMQFNWLKKLKTTIDFRVNIEQFTFLERQGPSASFRIFAKDNQFGVYNIRFYYPNDTLEANFSLGVSGEQPFVSLLLNTSELDLDYFSLEAEEKKAAQKQVITVLPMAEPMIQEPPAPPMPVPPTPTLPSADVPPVPETQPPAAPITPIAERKWSEELIDMSWMEGVAGTFDITIGSLIYKKDPIYNIKLKADLSNNMLSLKGASFAYWRGRCDLTGSLYGGKVPGLSIGFTLYDAELQDILRTVVGRENITGKTSISGTVTTSGVNYLSWGSQADAKLVMTARGVVVYGLNLQGVTDAVAVSRTAADVFNNVNLALLNGNTEMSVDGNINVKNGVLRTPGITLKSGSITGNLTGEIKLVPWTMDLSTFFQFPTMTSETVPTMTVQLKGPINAPELRTDTSSLEAYVAKRIIGR